MRHYFVFDVRLLGVDRPIWRRFSIQKSKTFRDLHRAIQDACGWEDYHMFAFHATEKGPVIAGIPDQEYSPDEPDAEKVKLRSFFDKKASTHGFYQYDFGDDWWHVVELVDSLVEPVSFTRKLLDGQRSFPPEDCGGISGFETFVEVISGKAPSDGTERDELLQWLGDWTPDGFQLEESKKKFDF